MKGVLCASAIDGTEAFHFLLGVEPIRGVRKLPASLNSPLRSGERERGTCPVIILETLTTGSATVPQLSEFVEDLICVAVANHELHAEGVCCLEVPVPGPATSPV